MQHPTELRHILLRYLEVLDLAAGFLEEELEVFVCALEVAEVTLLLFILLVSLQVVQGGLQTVGALEVFLSHTILQEVAHFGLALLLVLQTVDQRSQQRETHSGHETGYLGVHSLVVLPEDALEVDLHFVLV